MAETSTFDIYINIKNQGAFKQMEMNAKKAHNAMDARARKTTGIYNSLKTTMMSMFGVFAAGMATINSIKIFAGFEKEMSTVKALTQSSGAEFESLKKQAEDLGKTTMFSAKQAAEGMSFLAMAGFKTDKILGAMPGVLDLAAAGSIDLGTAADIASNILTQFGIRAENLGRVNDIIAATSTNANTNIQQLAEGLKYAGTTSKILQIPLEEVSAAIGILANAGLQGSMGGTSLNFAMLEMARQSSPTSKKLKALGVSTLDSTGKFVGLINILKQFEERGIKSTTILDTFGARGGRAMGTLVEAGSAAVEALQKINETSEGLAHKIAQTKIDNLAGDVTILKSAYQGLVISINKGFGGAMRKTVQRITDMVRWLEKNTKTIQKLLRWIGKIIKLTLIYKGVMMGISLAMKAAAIVTNIYRFALIAQNRGLKSAITLTKLFNKTMKASIIGLVVTGLVLLIAKYVRYLKKLKELTPAQKAFNERLQKTKDLIKDINETKILFENVSLLSKGDKEDLFSDISNQLRQLEKLRSETRVANKTSKEYEKLISLTDKYNKQEASGGLLDFTLPSKIKEATRLLDDAFTKASGGIVKKALNEQINTLKNQLKVLGKQGIGDFDSTLTPAKGVNDMVTELSTKRNIRNITLNIQQLTGVENINTTNITESSQEIGRIILEELNKTAAQFATTQ